MIPAKPDDCVAWITVRLHAHGEMSVSGTFGDREFAVSMLDHARDAIGRQVPARGELIVPNRDVDVVPYDGLREIGDIPVRDRGDP